MTLRIVCAACRHPDGRIVTGPRHFDHTMWAQILGMSPEAFEAHVAVPAHEAPPEVIGWGSADQGFIDQRGTFHSREDAWKIAKANGQVRFDPNWQTGRVNP
jgi:hypothetical protein